MKKDLSDVIRFFDSPPVLPANKVELSVGFFLAPCFTLYAFAGFSDVLRHAADEANFSRQIYCQWKILSLDSKPITSSCGIEVLPNSGLEEAEKFDYLVVVGGTLPATLTIDPRIIDQLLQANARNQKLIGLCTGSFILAQAGILDGKKCALAIGHQTEFGILYPDIPSFSDRTFIEDGNIITCPGGATSVDLAVKLVAQHCGPARAQKSLRSMHLDSCRESYEFPIRPKNELLNCGDWRVEKAVRLMEENLATAFSIGELATRIGTTVAKLSHSFKKRVRMSPGNFWRKLRLEHAQWLILNTTRPLATIALECGFYDSAHFSKAYKALFGCSPQQARQENKRRLSLTRHQE